jgi:hypothetical protein
VRFFESVAVMVRKPAPGQAKGNANVFVEFERPALEIEALDAERAKSAQG